MSPEPKVQASLFMADSPETAVADAPENYHIPLHAPGPAKSDRRRVDENIEALRVLQQIESEQRWPTPAEQARLALYAAFGGAANAVDPRRSEWVGELPLLLSDEQLRSIRASTPYAFFTPVRLARTMWDAAARLGFRGGEVLEPACGTGVFFGGMPLDVAAGSRLTGVELDQVSGRIAQLLYPQADIHLCGLEDTDFDAASYDLVIGNVPFGQVPIHDPAVEKSLRSSIHNYFLVRTMQLVRPGGLVLLIASRYVMDAKDNHVRAWLAQHANLLGAFRLPGETFAEAGADVVTDLLIFQRTDDPESDPVWLEIEMVSYPARRGGSTTSHFMPVNRWFLKNPQTVIGEPYATSSLHGYTYALRYEKSLAAMVQDLAEQMVRVLPVDVHEGEPVQPETPAEQSGVTADDEIADGAFFFGPDGRIYQNDGGNGRLVRGGKKTLARIAGMIEVRDVARELLALNLDPDSDLAPLQARLLWKYQLFVSRHGFLNNNANTSAFAGDPDAPFLRALELYDEDTGIGKPASIFFKRTIGEHALPENVETAQEALALSLNVHGQINWSYMEQLTERPFDELVDELDGQVFQTPAGEWQPASKYLSGNVRQKLVQARAAAEQDPGLRANVAALESVLPDDLLPEEIVVQLGAGWVPAPYVEQFLNELFIEESMVNNLDNPAHQHEYRVPDWHRVRAVYIEPLAQWEIDGGSDWGVLATSAWGTKRVPAMKLADQALNGKVPTVYDTVYVNGGETRVVNHEETIAAREKQDRIKRAFRQWIWLDGDRREYLARLYNDRFNSYLPAKYDGSHLTLPGLGVDMPPLRLHQKNAIWRGMQGNNVLLWHVVGAGKTFVMIGTGIEMRRLGLRSKVAHVVPNHLLDQYAASFYRMYPGASLLLINSKKLTKQKRQTTLARIATGDWDAIIMTHAAFGRIPVSDETFADFIQRQIDQLETYLYGIDKKDPSKRLSLKEIEKQKKRLEEKLEERQERVKRGQDTRGLTWEQLGIDLLFVDEAHEFKNLWFPTKLRHLPGVGGTESGRAMDMFIKTQHMTRRCECGRLLGRSSHCGCPRGRRVDGHSVVFATGTALANTISEIYTMQRYLQYDTLLELGLAHFDAWAAQFGDTVTLLEMKPSGTGWRQNTRFAKFNNVPELLAIFDQVADMAADMDELGIVRPRLAGGRPIGIEAEPSNLFEAFMANCAWRADNLRNVKPHEDNMLKIMGDAKKAALHMGLVDRSVLDPDYIPPDDDPPSKVDLCIDEVYRIWHETTAVKLARLPGQTVSLTQIVFLDTSTPKKGWNLYDYIKDGLIAKGIPAAQIAFIHDATNDAARLKMFEAVNEGKIRVLLGSTTKMGTGANMQRLLFAEHDLDAPWRPADIEQRQGRILRQGNLNEAVEIYRYITSGSLDFYTWHLLELKQKFIRQIMERRVSQRSVEDIDAVVIGFAEMKAMATGDQLMMEKVEVESRLSHLYALRSQHYEQRRRLQAEFSELPARIEHLRQTAVAYAQAVERYHAEYSDEFRMTVLGVTYSERPLAGAAFTDLAVRNLHRGEQIDEAAVLYGFPIHTAYTVTGRFAFIVLAQKQWLKVEMGTSALGNISRLQNALKDLPKRVEEKQRQLAALERQLPQMEQRLAAPFEYESELDGLERRLMEIETEIEARYKEELEKEKAEHKAVVEASAVARKAAAADDVRKPSPMERFVHTVLHKHGVYEKFEEDELASVCLVNEPYMPLVIERLPDYTISVAHYYRHGGDGSLQVDPEIVFRLSDWKPVEITQPAMVVAGREIGGYKRLTDKANRPDPAKVKDVETFVKQWVSNLRAQGWLDDDVRVAEWATDVIRE